MRSKAFLWTALLSGAFAATPSRITAHEELAAESYERLRDFIVPSADELAWREIPWRPTFAAAVREAAETDRPILLWAMNGHPLGCT